MIIFDNKTLVAGVSIVAHTQTHKHAVHHLWHCYIRPEIYEINFDFNMMSCTWYIMLDYDEIIMRAENVRLPSQMEINMRCVHPFSELHVRMVMGFDLQLNCMPDLIGKWALYLSNAKKVAAVKCQK